MLVVKGDGGEGLEKVLMEECVVARVLVRLYPRVSTLWSTLEDLKGKSDLLLPTDTLQLRKTCTSTLVAWNSNEVYLNSWGTYEHGSSYELPKTKGAKCTPSASLERVLRTAKSVSDQKGDDQQVTDFSESESSCVCAGFIIGIFIYSFNYFFFS